jgi:hypothetical protein
MGLGSSVGAAMPWITGAFALDQILLGGSVTNLIGDLFGFGNEPARYKYQTGGKNFEDNVSVSGVYGSIGFSDYAKNISAKEFTETFQAIANLDQTIASALSPEQNKKIKEALDNFTSSKNESTAEYIADRIKIMADVLSGGINELVDKFKGTSEELVTYFTRLTQVKPTLDAFKQLGKQLGDTEAKAIQAAIALEDAAGGQQAVVSALNSYYQNFYSEQEKVANITNTLTEEFSKLGMNLPKTTREFRSLMDEAIGSGNTGLIASLLGLQQVFFDLANTTSETTNNLLEEINRLRAANTADSSNTAGLQSEFSALTAMARAGDLSAIAKLPGVSQAIEADMQNFAASASDVVFARAWLAQSLQDTMAVVNGTASAGSVVNTAGTISGSTAALATNTTATTGSSIATATMSQTDLIAALIVEVQLLRAEVRADVDANSKSARILDRAMQDGESLNVTVLA